MADRSTSGEGDPAKRRRGKPARSEDRALSRETILAAAVRLVDEVGTEAFSVRTLAQRLGVYPAAIYWWLPTRNDVLAGIVGHALAGIRPPDTIADWQSWVAELLRRHRAAVRRHPRVAPLIGAPFVADAGLDPSSVEKLIGMLADGGFAGATLVSAFDIVVAAQIGFVSLEFASWPAGDAGRGDRLQRLAGGPDVVASPDPAMHVPFDDRFEAHVHATIAGLRALLIR